MLPETAAYRLGYLCGIFEGDGSLGVYPRQQRHDFMWRAALVMKDAPALAQAKRCAEDVGLDLRDFVHISGGPHSYAKGQQRIPGLAARGKAMVSRLACWLADPRDDDPEWIRGYLAGIFDAEGSYLSGPALQPGSLRIAQCASDRRRRIAIYVRRAGFTCVEEARAVRLLGGVNAALRFFAYCRPALLRKLNLEGMSPKSQTATLLAVEPLGRRDLADISVDGAPTYYAAGLPSHNCYQGSHVAVPAGLKKHMPAEVMERALPWAVSWTTRGLHVCWYGGEPTLSFDLVREQVPRWNEAFARAGKELTWSVTTNGSLLSPTVRAFLDEHDFGLLLSLDGPQRTHDQTRVYYDTDPKTGRPRGTWSSIPVAEILAWRPNLEIAWQLDPAVEFTVEDLDELLARGFHAINFNINWMVEWPPAARLRLEVFMRAVARRCITGRMASNWMGYLEKALTVDQKMAVPCGTGLAMLGLSPEGWLYPSQEMVYTTVLPGRAPGTAEHYRVGDVFRDPVIDQEVLRRVSAIRTEQMRPPPPFDCNNCIARSVSIGGCHCRYVGQDARDPANRFDVLPGYCQSMVSAMTGMVQGAAIERWVRPVKWIETQRAAGRTPGGLIEIQRPRARPPAASEQKDDLAQELLARVRRIDRQLQALELIEPDATGTGGN